MYNYTVYMSMHKLNVQVYIYCMWKYVRTYLNLSITDNKVADRCQDINGHFLVALIHRKPASSL